MLSTKRTKPNLKIIIKISTSSDHQFSSSPSATTIANNDDLLTEILLCLPIKSLLKFKSVSKHWLSLITNPAFSLRRTPLPNSISGLFVRRSNRQGRSIRQDYDFINLASESDPSHPPFESLTFLHNKAEILQSCNGLMLLCSMSGGDECTDNYCVYNPTTRQCTVLPPFPVNEVFKATLAVNLAYDPSKSPDYKVICIRSYENTEEGEFQIEIYSSETGPWRKPGVTFTAHYETNFGLGMFWNGSLHWISPWDNSLYFDVEEETVYDLPMPDIDGDFRRRFRYFRESRGHLHLIELYIPCTVFNVYEMERDYSGWAVKYRVDLLGVAEAFPEMVRPQNFFCHGFYRFSLLCIVREEKEEDSYLVLHIPNKAIRYNLTDKSFRKIREIAPVGREIQVDLEYRWGHAFQYFESLAYV